MFSIILGFPKVEDGKSIKNLLVRNGYQVMEPCTLASQIISMANHLDEGIIICGYRFSDMQYNELYNYLPKGFEMLLLASPEKLAYCQENIVCLRMPIKSVDLLNTLQMMTYQYQKKKKKLKEKPKERSQDEKELIMKAKMILMERNNMSEEEAYRYIQKSSMDSSTTFVEMAEMVIKMFY